MPSSPILSIGLPVYNGERFLAKALNSLLSQTYSDFELFLSDNASTDHTEEICRDYASRDRRIRYFRNATNMGAGWNFLRVYRLAQRKYYKQAAHDDFCEPRFLEVCVNALEQDAELIVACTKTRIVDADGRFLEDYECPLRIEDRDPVTRFSDLVLLGHRCFPIFGVHRRSALERLPPMGSFAHADRILLAQLGLMGRFYESPERLFISTRHSGQSVWTVSARSSDRRIRLTDKVGTLPSLEWWDTRRKKTITLPEWHAFYQYCHSIQRSSLTALQKATAYRVMARWAIQYHRRLLGDFVLAADQVLWNWQSRRNSASRTEAEKRLTTPIQGGKGL